MSERASSPSNTAAPPEPATRTRGWPWAEAGFPLVLVALGVFVVVEAATIRVPPSANVAGPQVFPYAIGVLLAATGAAVLVGLARGRRGEAEAGEDVDPDVGTDWPRVALLVGSLLALVVLIEPLGWPIAATVLFGGAAATLGARPLWRPFVIGAVLALVTQVLFTQGLGVFLPAGPLSGVPFLG